MRLIVIEGIDGAGKSTQIELIKEMLGKSGIESEHLHFPRTKTPYSGELIARFLRGEFGSVSDVDPYLVAMLYASDRRDAAPWIREWLEKGKVVILDRYTYSNIAYQCAKTESGAPRERLREWILSLEFDHYKIPVPDLNIFLDVPLRFSESTLRSDRGNDSDRSYLMGQTDIHEADNQFQRKVRDIYIETSQKDSRLTLLECSDEDGNMLSKEMTFKKVSDLVRKVLKI